MIEAASERHEKDNDLKSDSGYAGEEFQKAIQAERNKTDMTKKNILSIGMILIIILCGISLFYNLETKHFK